MGLDDYLTDKEQLGDNWSKFLKLKEKFQKEGLPEHIAVYKATSFLTPDKLEKLKLTAEYDENVRQKIEFYFNTKEELKLVAKYFKINILNQVGNSSLLIKLLELLENG